MNKQSIYVKPNEAGACFTWSYDDKYANQQGWHHVFVDQDHLYGFIKQPYEVKYDDALGILRYPGYWESDPSSKLADVIDQLKQARDDNSKLAAKLTKAVKNSNNLSNIVMGLQKQIADLQTEGSAK